MNTDKLILFFSFFVLAGFIGTSCNLNHKLVFKSFEIKAEYYEMSSVELKNGFLKIDSITKSDLVDGTIYLNESMAKSFNEQIRLDNTLELFDSGSIRSIYMKSPELILYEILSGNGFYTWRVHYLVYNPAHLNYETMLQKDFEELTYFKRIEESNWYVMEILRNID